MGPDIVPMPHAEVSSSGPILPSPTDRKTSRQPLELLDSDITKNQGNSSLAQNALGVVKGYLDSSQITDLYDQASEWYRETALIRIANSSNLSIALGDFQKDRRNLQIQSGPEFPLNSALLRPC